MGQHLFLNIIPNNFTVRTGREVWCDRGLSQNPSNKHMDSNHVHDKIPLSILANKDLYRHVAPNVRWIVLFFFKRALENGENNNLPLIIDPIQPQLGCCTRLVPDGWMKELGRKGESILHYAYDLVSIEILVFITN